MRLLAMLLPIGMLVQASSTQSTTPANQSTRPTAQRGTDSEPVSVKLLNTGKPDEEARQDKLWSYTLFGLAAFQTVILLASMADTRKNARIQQRAYVGITAKRLAALPVAGDRPQFKIDIKNYGQTPAHTVDVSFGWSMTRFPHEKDYEFPAKQPPVDFGFILEPGEEKQLTTTLPDAIDAGHADAIRTGRIPEEEADIRLCVSGRIIYFDAFEERHIRRFCYFYGGEQGLRENYCMQHNTET